MRPLTFSEAIREAFIQEMAQDDKLFLYGIGTPDPMVTFGSTAGLVEKFGIQRCFDTPLSEDAMTGFGLGAAMNGLHPIQTHIRVDFLLLGYNQIANMISCCNYLSGGDVKTSMVIRAIVGRGWGQGAQHSKSMHSVFAHIPGIKVVIPTTAYDAKGLMISAIRDPNPVIYIDHRWLHWQIGNVPQESYAIPLGEGNILRKGKDITIVATSWMNVEAVEAADILSTHGISVEIIDPRTIVPLNDEFIVKSVEKTGYCIVADNDWAFCGFSAEVAAIVSHKCFSMLKAPVERIAFAHIPCPTARHLENVFYPNAETIIRTVERMLKLEPIDLTGVEFYSHEKKFKGPF